MILSGCARSTEPQLKAIEATAVPPLPGDLAVVPPMSPLREGDDARVALAASRRDVSLCRTQYVDLKTYYEAFTAGSKTTSKRKKKNG